MPTRLQSRAFTNCKGFSRSLYGTGQQYLATGFLRKKYVLTVTKNSAGVEPANIGTIISDLFDDTRDVLKSIGFLILPMVFLFSPDWIKQFVLIFESLLTIIPCV